MTDDLRERVYARIAQARNDAYMDCRGMVPFRAAMMVAVDDLIALFAEREREAATGGYVVGAKHAGERCAEREREHDLSASIGEWIITTSRESPGRRICTGWVIDGREVLVGIFGDAKQEPKDRRWWAR